MPKPCAYCRRADYVCSNCTAPAPISTRGVMRSPVVPFFLSSFFGAICALAVWSASTTFLGCYGVDMPAGASSGVGGFGGHAALGATAAVSHAASSASSSVASSAISSSAAASSSGTGGAPVSLLDAGQGGFGGSTPQCAVDLDCWVSTTCTVWGCIAGACLATEAPQGSPCLETCVRTPCLPNVRQPSLRVGYCDDGVCAMGIPVTCLTPSGSFAACQDAGVDVSFAGSQGCAYVGGVGYSVGYCAPGVACSVTEIDGGAAVGSCL